MNIRFINKQVCTSHVRLPCNPPWTVAHQALCLGFSRQEILAVGCHGPLQDPLTQGSNLRLLCFLHHWQVFLNTSAT